MTTLITGAGAIGARALIERGEPVVLLDAAPDLSAIRHYVDPDRFAVVKQDVCDYEGVLDLVRRHKVKRILHTAAMLTRALRVTPREGVMVNILGTTNVLEAARTEKLGRVVLASSGIVGYPTFGSFRGERFPEDFPMKALSERPSSLYAITKLSGEYLGLYYHQTYQTDVVVLRYQAVLAPFAGPSRNVTGLFGETLLKPAMEGRTAVIDDPLIVWAGGEEFIDVRDVVSANIAALDTRAPATRVYNMRLGPHEHVRRCRRRGARNLPVLPVRTQGGNQGRYGGISLSAARAFRHARRRIRAGFQGSVQPAGQHGVVRPASGGELNVHRGRAGLAYTGATSIRRCPSGKPSGLPAGPESAGNAYPDISFGSQVAMPGMMMMSAIATACSTK